MMWLSLQENVVTTPSIERTAAAMDSFFEGHQAIITSGFRTAEKQLAIIQSKAKRHGIAQEFEEFQEMIERPVDFMVKVEDKGLFWWQRTWSKLLSIGDIVNPPLPAVVLFDYFRPGSKENRKGEWIGISPHQKGFALDIGGGNDLQEKAKRVMHAHQTGAAFIDSFLIERINNAVHVDCAPIQA